MAKRKPRPRKNAAGAKPYPEFPLTPHPSGRWRKIHRGTAHYFGDLADWEAALDLYKHQWPYILAGKRPPPMPGEDKGDGYTSLADAIDLFLEHKEQLAEQGEIGKRYWHDLLTTCRLIKEAVDGSRDIESIDRGDFAAIRETLAKGRGLVSLNNHITRARSFFKWTLGEGIRQTPLLYGERFATPSAKAIRIEQSRKPDKAFTPAECRALIDGANVHLRAMILLALNAGYGAMDCADLNLRDIGAGMLKVSRGKTGFARRAVLWSETIEAMEASLDVRPEPTVDEAGRAVFVTAKGYRVRHRAVTVGEDGKHKLNETDAVAQAFSRLKKRVGIKGRGRGFYGLRHAFRTATDGLPDRAAVDLVMGHDDPKDMRGRYVRPGSIARERLQAVADCAHRWVFGEEGGDAE